MRLDGARLAVASAVGDDRALNSVGPGSCRDAYMIYNTARVRNSN